MRIAARKIIGGRKQWFLIALGVLLTPFSLVSRANSQQPPFVAYGASASVQEIVAVRFTSVGGKLASVIVQREPLGFEAAPVVFHAQYRLLYVASLRAKEVDGNKLLVFSVGKDGRLTRKKEVELPHGSAYLSLDRSGRFLLSASYFEGHVDIHRLDVQGIPTTLVGTNYEGRDKAHSIRTTRDNRFAYVPYVKDRNALYQYAFDEKSGKLLALDPPQANVPTGIGPRHVAYHPTEPFVYFSNEQHLGAIAYRIQRGGTLQLLQVCQPGDLKPAEGLAASDILITPDGLFLYVGVRDFDKGLVDAIHRYAVSPDGTLTHLGQTKSDAIPWGLQLSPDGRHLLVTATNGGTLTAFEITTDGDLAKRTSIGWGKMIRAIAVVEVE
ncbi:MAG TPA: hypothetical protein EYQ75_03600 [Planctomycetaceae bacterium]|nr:hypothetical protein [Planctomycetaceae bacterium]